MGLQTGSSQICRCSTGDMALWHGQPLFGPDGFVFLIHSVRSRDKALNVANGYVFSYIQLYVKAICTIPV